MILDLEVSAKLLSAAFSALTLYLAQTKGPKLTSYTFTQRAWNSMPCEFTRTRS